MACHLNGPWHVIRVQEGSAFCNASSTRTPSSPPIRVCRSSSLASSGTLLGLSRAWLLLASSARVPDKSCPYFTVANVHINNECAKRRSVCIALLLLIRDLCLKLGGVVLTGDFNKTAERELLRVDHNAAFPRSRRPSARRCHAAVGSSMVSGPSVADS